MTIKSRIAKLEGKSSVKQSSINALDYDVYARALAVAREVVNALAINDSDTTWLKAEAVLHEGQANNIYRTVLNRLEKNE